MGFSRKRHDSAATSLALGAFSGAERVKVIDAPQDPKVPVTLPAIVFILAGLFVGLSLGIGLAVAAEMLDQRVRYAAEFRALLSVPVIARLPFLHHSGSLQY